MEKMPDSLSHDRRPHIASGYRFQWEPSQNCHVLLYPEGMITLNASAGEILKRCDGSATIQEIIDQLKGDFPGVDLESDVMQFLEDAHERGWITAK